MEIILRSKGEGEEMRKTALFLLSEAWAKASFLLSSLVLSLLSACCSGSRAESPEERELGGQHKK